MMSMIFIASDHAGFKLKEHIKTFLTSSGYGVEDQGPDHYDPCDDFPDYAIKVCRSVLEKEGVGILICGTGQGMDRVANKIPGIHAALCWNEFTASCAREHGDTNVLTLGGRTTSDKEAETIVKVWLETTFSGENRHIRRINKIRQIEKKCMKSPDLCLGWGNSTGQSEKSSS